MPTATATAPSRTKAGKQLPKREPVTPSWVGRVPQLKPGQYADGMPIHSPEYVCCKLILRPNKFHSRESFFDFGKVFKEPAKEHGVKYTTEGFLEQPVKIREVLFIDTDDFRLYNNAFILRRRIPYKDGFPIGEPEIVFKFRHPDLQMCGRNRRPAEHPRRPPREVQGPGPALEGEAGRHPSALLSQRAIHSRSYRLRPRKYQRHGRFD